MRASKQGDHCLRGQSSAESESPRMQGLQARARMIRSLRRRSSSLATRTIRSNSYVSRVWAIFMPFCISLKKPYFLPNFYHFSTKFSSAWPTNLDIKRFQRGSFSTKFIPVFYQTFLPNLRISLIALKHAFFADLNEHIYSP